MLSIDDAMPNMIPELLPKRPGDHLKGPASVVPLQVLDVFERKAAGRLAAKICATSKKGALRLTREAVTSTPESSSSDAAMETLAGNPANRTS